MALTEYAKIAPFEVKDNIFISVPNFPINNFVFPDITPILEEHPLLFKLIIDTLTQLYFRNRPDYILCVESFGYVFGVPLAYNLGCKILLARKKGKLPRHKLSKQYSMVYCSKKVLEIHKDVLQCSDSVLIIDDFLATGGTASAVASLVKMAGANVLGCTFIAELPDINGRVLLSRNGIMNINALFQLKFSTNSQSWKIVTSSISEVIIRKDKPC